MIARPGGFIWLLRHDLKLNFLRFRGMFGDRGPWTVASIAALAFVAIHLLCWPVAAWFVKSHGAAASVGAYYPALACAALFVMPWMASQALMNSTRALYTRGDLDLILTSPMSARAVVSSRALAIAFEAVASVGVFLFPIADMNALLGGARWLAVYPALMASGLMATAVGLALTVGLFALVGPRKTRVVSQIVATFIASALVLGGQVVNLLPEATRGSIWAMVEHPAPGSLFDPNIALWTPVRAAMGGGRDLAVWAAVSTLAFVVAAVAFGPYFMASAVRSAGAAATAGPRKSARRRDFRVGVAASLRRKEWRLLARDPWLFSQMLLQVIYTLPISVVVWRSPGVGGAIGLAVSPFVVVIASQISASLAWLAMSSEDAPEFLATAPVARSQVERGKMEAVFIPLAALLAGPLIGLALIEPGTAALTAVIAALAASSTALLNLWHPMPGKRSQLLRRHSQSKFVGLMEHGLAMSWALVMALALYGSALALAPVAIVAGLLWFNRPDKWRRAAAPRLALAR